MFTARSKSSRSVPLYFGAFCLMICIGAVAAPRARQPRREPAPSAAESAKAWERAIELGREAQQELATIEDYTADFRKIERIGPTVIEQAMGLKFRQKPFSVYVHFNSLNERGREAIYVDGAFEGRLLVHQPGVLGALAGTHRLKIDEWPVSLENRYPVTEIGIGRILEKALAEWRPGEAAPPKSAIFRIAEAEADGVPCQVVEVESPRRNAMTGFSLSRVFFSEKTKLPIRAERYGWPEKAGGTRPVLEIYEYRNIQVNVGLKNADFDPTNPAYGFGSF